MSDFWIDIIMNDAFEQSLSYVEGKFRNSDGEVLSHAEIFSRFILYTDRCGSEIKAQLPSIIRCRLEIARSAGYNDGLEDGRR